MSIQDTGTMVDRAAILFRRETVKTESCMPNLTSHTCYPLYDLGSSLITDCCCCKARNRYDDDDFSEGDFVPGKGVHKYLSYLSSQVLPVYFLVYLAMYLLSLHHTP